MGLVEVVQATYCRVTVESPYVVRSMGRMSERITDTEVEGRIAPFECFLPPLSDRQARVVEADTPVETYDYQLQVVAQPEARVESQLLVEAVETEYLVLGGAGYAGHPYVACVEEYGAVQRFPQRETEFQIGFQTQVAELAFVA